MSCRVTTVQTKLIASERIRILVVAVHSHADLGLNLSGILRVSFAHIFVRGFRGDAHGLQVNNLLFNQFDILLGVDSNLLKDN